MTLIASTSGIRGIVGTGITPQIVTNYAAAFGTWLKKGKVVIGRDSRPSGDIYIRAAIAGLTSVGIDVIDVGIVPTPTVEIAVHDLKAAGGICITASHNPAQWNAMKFFNARGEFITPEQYQEFSAIYESGKYDFKPYDKLGKVTTQDGWIRTHIRKTLAVKTVNRSAIKRAKFRVVVDCINGAGSTALPLLLEELGVRVIRLNCEGDGNFVREPEPIPKNLAQVGKVVKQKKAHCGLVTDPDADRLAIVDELGRPIGEELTLAIAVKQVLKSQKGPTVINLSTSKVTADTAESCGSKVYYSKVGESNVVQMMREKKAVIGGEGNGGVIYPSFHAGRDSLIAAALVLSCLAEEKLTMSRLAGSLPTYYTEKAKGALVGDFSLRLATFELTARELIGDYTVDRRDGLRFDFSAGWVQIRTSNTEPIFRVIVETNNKALTGELTATVMSRFTA
ncbi:MAG: phosphoglucosamine mutase [Candidatus Zixiibacteriota bacterium]